MQVSGKILVLATFAIGFAMAGGAWWYNFQQSRLAAGFWGPQAATLIVASQKLELLELDEPFDPAEEREPAGEASAAASDDETAADAKDLLAGRPVLRVVDITTKPGAVHLRHALTYDENYDWAAQQSEPLIGDSDWKYALRFATGEQAVVVLFTASFTRLGRLDDAARDVATLPCPRLGPVVSDYLSMRDVGALPPPVDAATK